MSSRNYWGLAGLFGVQVRAAIRILQFVLAVVTIILVATDLTSASKNTTHIYGFFVAATSILIDIWHCLATVKHAAWLIFDFILAVLWAALAGAIGSVRVNGGPFSGSHRQRVMAIMGLGIVCMVLWICSCTLGWIWCCTSRKVLKKEENLELAESTER